MLVGATGSVASIKIPLLVQRLLDSGVRPLLLLPSLGPLSHARPALARPQLTASPPSLRRPAMQADVEVVRTGPAGHFFKDADLSQGVRVHTDAHEWEVSGRGPGRRRGRRDRDTLLIKRGSWRRGQSWNAKGDPVLHIEVRRGAQGGGRQERGG